MIPVPQGREKIAEPCRIRAMAVRAYHPEVGRSEVCFRPSKAAAWSRGNSRTGEMRSTPIPAAGRPRPWARYPGLPCPRAMCSAPQLVTALSSARTRVHSRVARDPPGSGKPFACHLTDVAKGDLVARAATRDGSVFGLRMPDIMETGGVHPPADPSLFVPHPSNAQPDLTGDRSLAPKPNANGPPAGFHRVRSRME